jgi:UDP-N-acetyl-2-amino-2-deoxyglucuronate dehydrogenase
MKKLRYALIGCGRIAMNHIYAYLDNRDDLELVALCDVNVDSARKLLETSEIKDQVKIYESYTKMLDLEKLDLVAITTISGTHAKIALECLNHKVSVIVEKPMALSIADADLMIETARKNKVKLAVAYQNRFNKSIQKLREAYELEKFGKVFYGTANVRWNRGSEYYNQASWRGTWEHDGGALMNQCIHNIDLLVWMMGDVDEVFAYADNLNHPYIEGEDLALALVKFKNKSYGVIEGTVNVYPQNLEETLYIFGENGTVKVGGESVNKIEVWRFEGDKNESAIIDEFKEEPPNVYGFGHAVLYRDMVSAIRNDRSPIISGEEGKKSLEVVLAIYKSAKEGKPVKLPLTNFGTADMVKKN